MTADCDAFPHEFLGQVATWTGNEVKGISWRVYDLTPNPPGTIERG
jgi:GMP synthase PP-ATPase subunit